MIWLVSVVVTTLVVFSTATIVDRILQIGVSTDGVRFILFGLVVFTVVDTAIHNIVRFRRRRADRQ